MPDTLDIVCPNCGRTLRMASEHAGKPVRCPACQQISAAPAPPAAEPANLAPRGSPPVETPAWHVRTPEGTVYGPIHWNELLTWVSEGRVAADCELANATAGPWQPAGRVLPVLNTSPPANFSSPAASPAIHPAAAAPASACDLSHRVAPAPFGALAPHRGPLILVFGLVGIMMGCPAMSALAWILGSRDLREMRSGRMDRQGENLTLVGMILGMILSILWLVVTFIVLTVALIAFALNN